jgi:hypothetical protein
MQIIVTLPYSKPCHRWFLKIQRIPTFGPYKHYVTFTIAFFGKVISLYYALKLPGQCYLSYPYEPTPSGIGMEDLWPISVHLRWTGKNCFLFLVCVIL